MTTSPEERAKDIHDRLFRLGKYHFENVHMDPLEFIASAIREAEDAVIERIATIYGSEIDFDAAAIRDLKRKET